LQAAALLFSATYILLLALTKYRAFICVASAALFVLLGILPAGKALSCVDWNVILMIVGMMGIMYLFCGSGMPALLADIIVERSPTVAYAAVALSLFAGAISAFVDNVATVLMVAPVAISVARKLRIDPCPIVVAVSVSSNLQGAATLVGDTTSIMLSGAAGMDFSDFFFFRGRPGLFWIVEVSALAATLVLLRLFRGGRGRMPHVSGRTSVTDLFPTALLVFTVAALAAVSFIPEKPPWANGGICAALFIAGLMRDVLVKKSAGAVRGAFADMDLTTVCVLACLFVIVGGMSEAGVIDAIAAVFVRICGNSLFLTYTLVVWFSVAVSAVVDNIPYVATMLPVVSAMSVLMNIEPYLLYFGLLTGATLGGNMTPVGASANITAIGLLEKEGVHLRPSQFMRIGVPFTLAAVVTGYILLWLLWS